MIGLSVDGFEGEYLNIVCTDCRWIQTLSVRHGWYQRGEPQFVLADIVVIADRHVCETA